jgi:chorismate--pyruvate lyase
LIERFYSLQNSIEPKWYLSDSWRESDLPVGLIGWLLDGGSLTSKLIDCCSTGIFKVRLISQGWTRPLRSERELLGIPRDEVALTRQVQLLCGDVPWVFARTLIPASSFKGKARRLAYLKSKPLGAVLFSDPYTVRKTMEIAHFSKGHLLYQYAAHHSGLIADDLWGRRTLFNYARKPLLVNEIFLPGIPQDDLNER